MDAVFDHDLAGPLCDQHEPIEVAEAALAFGLVIKREKLLLRVRLPLDGELGREEAKREVAGLAGGVDGDFVAGAGVGSHSGDLWRAEFGEEPGSICAKNPAAYAARLALLLRGDVPIRHRVRR